ncbi:MAG: hypothetical protein U9Q90_11040 [Campylobacterota bacterium]|nr:hypothetical protein [Campylobacterota bacterium]
MKDKRAMRKVDILHDSIMDILYIRRKDNLPCEWLIIDKDAYSILIKDAEFVSDRDQYAGLNVAMTNQPDILAIR